MIDSFTEFINRQIPSLIQLGNFTEGQLNSLEARFQKHSHRVVNLNDINTTFFDLANIYPDDISVDVINFAQSIGISINEKLPNEKRSGLKEIIKRFMGTSKNPLLC